MSGTATAQVVSAFLQTMERFLAIEHTLISSTLAAPGDVNPGRAFPLIQIVSTPPGGPLVASCTLDLDEQPFLRDHTLGRDVSAHDPLLTGFPIVPFTALMEVMAEAATALAPSKVVIGMREVWVHRWLAVDRGPLHLEITAQWSDDARVAVQVVDASRGEASRVAEGVMLLDDSYPPPPEASRGELQRERRYKLTPERLYQEAMFHGPAFRGVRSMDVVGDNGAEATAIVVNRSALLAGGAADSLATDFVLLDQPGQVVGFWTAQYLERGFVVLPFRMGALDLYGPLLPDGEPLTCRARIQLVGQQQVRSNLDLVRADGRLWARFEEWEDRRFDLPEAAFRALLDPANARLSQPWPLVSESSEAGQLIACRIGLDAFPPGWLHAHGGMWARVLGALVLGRREREIWHALKAPEARRLEWLLGRIAAKDAVREFLQRRFHLKVHPADVQVLPDESGRPTVTGAWRAQAGISREPLVSISHVDGAAVAVLADGEAASGVGVDLERCGRMKPEMEHVAFTAPERELLARLDGDERQTWALRLWCAKEATAKATGCDAGPVSDRLAIERVMPDRGTVVVRYHSGEVGGRTLSAATARDGDWVVATCIR
jgi:phosphopantetheinyl transferase